MQRVKHAVASLFAIVAVIAQATTTTTVTDLPIDRGGTIRIAHTRPDSPRANIILMTGGEGVGSIPGLLPSGDGTNPNFYFNIPYRVRPIFADQGYSFIYVDVPSDLQFTGYSTPYRHSSTHLSELRAVLNYARQRDNVPTWVWGFGFGAISALNMAINLPADPPFGVVLLHPFTVDTSGGSAAVPLVLEMNLEAVRRPILVTNHAQDPCPASPPANVPIVVNRLTAAPARAHVVFTGGSGDTRPIVCDSTGHHGLGGQDAEFVSAVVGWTNPNAHLAQASNHTGLWWNPAENGWGINFNHQGDVLFATLYTYDASGQPLWLVMSEGRLRSDGSAYSGTLYRATGPAFNAVPFTPIGPANLTTVGNMQVTFTSAGKGMLTYIVNGTPVTKSIEVMVFGSRAANCMSSSGSRDALTNYQDLWWNDNESGWGVNVTHQDQTLFATLYTYDLSGRDLWLVMSGGTRQSDGSYLGKLYRTTGPAFNAVPFTPIGPANLTEVGTMRFSFTSGKKGTMTYSVNGIVVTKSIERMEFSSPEPSCS